MLPTNLEELERLLIATSIRMDLLELEVAMWKSEASRTKSAWKYAEEAIAAEYGIAVCEFRRKPVSPGRPKGDVFPNFRQAQFCLFSFLVHVVGETPNSVKDAYGPSVAYHARFWGELFNIVHQTREKVLEQKDAKLRAEKIERWDMYAHRYRSAYARWKQAMIEDGVWQYDEDLMTVA